MVLCIRYVPKLYLRVVGFCCGVILVLSRTPVRLTSMKQRQIMQLSQCQWSNPEEYENIGHVNLLHYSGIIMSGWCFKSSATRLFAQPFVQGQVIESIKPLRHCPLWGESTGDMNGLTMPRLVGKVVLHRFLWPFLFKLHFQYGRRWPFWILASPKFHRHFSEGLGSSIFSKYPKELKSSVKLYYALGGHGTPKYHPTSRSKP